MRATAHPPPHPAHTPSFLVHGMAQRFAQVNAVASNEGAAVDASADLVKEIGVLLELYVADMLRSVPYIVRPPWQTDEPR